MTRSKVVSLCPSITETLVAIGGLSSLVAVTRYCVRPKGMLWGLPQIGGTKSPDVGRIIDLKPDLVFANAEENRLEDVEALRKEGIDVDVTLPKRVADVPVAVRQWGVRLGGDCPSQAEALASRIESRGRALLEVPAPSPFRFAYWIWKDPWMTVSDDTYVADLLRHGGGINAFGQQEARYPTASPNEALARGAEIHFFPSEPYPFRADKHAALVEKVFGATSVRLFVDGDDYCWHGVRTLDGLERVSGIRKQIGNS